MLVLELWWLMTPSLSPPFLLLLFPVFFIQGISRSASIVIAYLIRSQGMSYDAALSFLKRKRACVKPNAGFAKALMEWEGYWAGRGAGGRPGLGPRRFTT